MAKRSSSPRFTYGLKKASILAALTNALFLFVAVGGIGAEAIRRLFHPSPTQGGRDRGRGDRDRRERYHGDVVLAGGQHDLNIRAAFVHMAADAAVSAAVVFAGFVILWTGQQWVDPVMSLAVAMVILWRSIGLLKELVGMSLMGVPSGIDVDQVEYDSPRSMAWRRSTTSTCGR